MREGWGDSSLQQCAQCWGQRRGSDESVNQAHWEQRAISIHSDHGNPRRLPGGGGMQADPWESNKISLY